MKSYKKFVELNKKMAAEITDLQAKCVQLAELLRFEAPGGTGAEPPQLTHDELIVACRNIGFDIQCGSCAALFYTGFGGYQHDQTCSSKFQVR